LLADLKSARVVIEDVAGNVEHTVWLEFWDAAHAVPLHPDVDRDMLQRLLRRPLTVDDRRSVRPPQVSQGG
jgi:hypothetical protein